MKNKYYDGDPATEAGNARERSLLSPNMLVTTHHCFDDAASYVVRVLMGAAQPTIIVRSHDAAFPAMNLAEGGKFYPLHVAHGVISVEGNDIVHAWVEHGELCLETFWRNGKMVLHGTLTDAYYVAMRARDVTRYEVEEFCTRWERTGSAGPWESRYLALNAKLRAAYQEGEERA